MNIDETGYIDNFEAGLITLFYLPLGLLFFFIIQS